MLLESLNIFFILLKKISWCSSACVWCSILIFMKFKERNNRRGGMAYSSIKRWIVGFWSISQQKSVIDVFCKLELKYSTCIMSSCWPPSFLILIYCKSNSFECRDQPTASSHTLWRIKHWCQSLTRFIAISLADKLFFHLLRQTWFQHSKRPLFSFQIHFTRSVQTIWKYTAFTLYSNPTGRLVPCRKNLARHLFAQVAWYCID